MNEMYEMSQSIHIFSVIVKLITSIGIILLHKSKMEQAPFAKQMAIIGLAHVSFLGSVMLTGMIMMAAKHLSFSFANMVMILGLIVIIVLEVKRNKLLKMVTRFRRVELEIYKPIGLNYVLVELVLLLIISGIATMAA